MGTPPQRDVSTCEVLWAPGAGPPASVLLPPLRTDGGSRGCGGASEHLMGSKHPGHMVMCHPHQASGFE
jgi:hypothetical protein